MSEMYQKCCHFFSYAPVKTTTFYILFVQIIFGCPSPLYDSRKLPFGDGMELNFYDAVFANKIMQKVENICVHTFEWRL